MAKSDLAGILKTLKTAKTFFLAGHQRPDGDTLGSGLALALALNARGKKATMYSGDPIPESLSFLPGLKHLKVGTPPAASARFDAAILMECSNPARMGPLLDLKKQAKTVISIDHHKTSEPYGHYNIIDASKSSNAEQLFEVFKALKWPVTPEMATCLWVGMTTDTGRFQYSNTTPSTLKVAAELLKTGIPAHDINHRLFRTSSLPALRLLARALTVMRLECGARLAVFPLSTADFEAAGASLEHTEEIVNYGLRVPGVEASVLLKEARDQIIVSLRSRGSLDVSAVAGKWGGGGHHNAAGCRVKEPLAKATLELEAALCTAIKENSPDRDALGHPAHR